MTALQIFLLATVPTIFAIIVYKGWEHDRRNAEIKRYIENCRHGAAKWEEE